MSDISMAMTRATMNRSEILAELECSCYSCTRVFPSAEVVKWTDDGTTAICPHCGVDSVIPGRYSDQLLAQMHDRWFDTPINP